ncbi:MAG: hypothetical protein KAI83_13495 [Thiomargarita sp.]|nr:hypothetical protein [Thiomargarita sp.]
MPLRRATTRDCPYISSSHVGWAKSLPTSLKKCTTKTLPTLLSLAE